MVWTEEEVENQEVTVGSQGSTSALNPKPATADTAAGGDDDYVGVP